MSSQRPVEPKEVVAAGYDQVADRYAALEAPEAEWPRMRWVEDLLARLPDRSDVLDVGCGNGVPGTRAIAERRRTTGVDVSKVQIELARRNVPEARLLHGDILSMQFPAGSFDAIVAFYVVEHLPRAEHARLLSRFSRWLRPGGYLLFTVEPEGEPSLVRDWLGTPMFFSQFDAETTAGLVQSAGFEVLRTATEVQLEGAREVPFTWLLARRPG